MDAGLDSSLGEFFSKMSDEGVTIVHETPRLDLELYLQNYEGRTRFDRLLLIGRSSVALSVRALQLAVAEAKNRNDVSRYKMAWDCIRVAAPGKPEAIRDDVWVKETTQANAAKLAFLEEELKKSKANGIKEPIRAANEDLGAHLEAVGQLPEALEAYGRMRQDVSSTKHIVLCSVKLAHVALQRREWSAALGHINKVTGVEREGEDSTKIRALTKAVSGIAHIGMKQMDTAADDFVRMPWVATDNLVDPEHPDESLYSLKHFISPNDVAIYGGLLALATMDKRALRARVLEGESFRSYIQSEPNIRRAINSFINGRYSACLSILESMRPDFLLDVYIQKAVPKIFAAIRQKCILEYTKPFSVVTIESLDQAFAAPGESILDEVVNLIRKGTLNARIDLMDKTIKAVRVDSRAKMHKEVLDTARKYEEEAKERLRRIHLICAGLELKGTRGGPAGPTDYDDNAAVDEAYFDDDPVAAMMDGIQS